MQIKAQLPISMVIILKSKTVTENVTLKEIHSTIIFQNNCKIIRTWSKLPYGSQGVTRMLNSKVVKKFIEDLRLWCKWYRSNVWNMLHINHLLSTSYRSVLDIAIREKHHKKISDITVYSRHRIIEFLPNTRQKFYYSTLQFPPVSN